MGTPILDYVPGGGVPTWVPAPPPDLPGTGVTNAAQTPLVNGQSWIQVAFDVAQIDTDWIFIECSVFNTTDANPLNIWPGIITQKTTTGFTLQLNGLPDSNNYYLDWAISGISIQPVPATTYILSGPASGSVGVPQTFTVRLPASTTVAAAVTVTMNDGGGGGAFSPSTVTITTASPSTTFTYTPASYGAKTISTTNNAILSDPSPFTFTCVAPTYSFSGPSTGDVGVASTNFTVVLSGPVVGTVVVTPSAGGGGGTFAPTTVNLTTGAPSATFTYTPASSGTKTISVTNSGGLTNPGNLSYIVYHIYYRSLTVDHTKVPSTQTDFPVLVSVTDATLKTIANGGHVQRSDGFDIGFFSDSAGTTPLKWEIEKYVPTTGELVAWVKIASLSSTVDTVFYLRYGDPTITTDHSDPVNVWSNSYIAVYHLGDGTTLNVNDSKAFANGTNHGATPVTGKVDGGANFSSSSVQYVEFASRTGPAALTLSCWVKAGSFPTGYNAIIDRGSGGNGNQIFVNSFGKIAIYLTAVTFGNVTYDGTGANTLSTGTWYYIAVTYDAATALIGYVNAGVDGTAPGGGNALDTTWSGISRIGSDPVNSGREWNGAIDEARVSSIARSANWITTEYNNQNAPGTFITVGVET